MWTKKGHFFSFFVVFPSWSKFLLRIYSFFAEADSFRNMSDTLLAKLSRVRLERRKTLGFLPDAVLSDSVPLVQCLLELAPSDQDIYEAAKVAVCSSSMEMVGLLCQFDSRNIMLSTALQELTHKAPSDGQIEVLNYLIRKKRYCLKTPYCYPIIQVLQLCSTTTLTYGGHAFRQWSKLLQPDEMLWTMHNAYRRMIRRLVQNGVRVDVRIRDFTSPFMTAAMLHFVCILLDLLRYGSGFHIRHRQDVRELRRILSFSVNPKFEESNSIIDFRRRDTRIAFILSVFPMTFAPELGAHSIIKKYTDYPKPPPSNHPTTLLYRQLVARISSPLSLQHSCRAVILQALDHRGRADAIHDLELPMWLENYLNLKDLIDQDKALCAIMMGVARPEVATDTDLYRAKCECIPL